MINCVTQFALSALIPGIESHLWVLVGQANNAENHGSTNSRQQS
jgi:hypothetical protein